MNKSIRFLMLCFCLSLNSNLFAATKQVAITIDDLPFVGTTHNKPGNLQREQDRFLRMMNYLIEHQVPATGFVIGGSIEKDQWQLLEQFHQNGFIIANHTHRHLNLNVTNPQKYMDDIAQTDKLLTPLMTETKYFRYPYLAEGRGDKKQQVRDFLANNNYIIAPVTIDSKDFRFNQQLMGIHWLSREKNIGPIKRRYLDYIWQQTLRAEKKSERLYGRPTPQILLIHANLLNSILLGDIIQMYKEKGYEVVSLDAALKGIDQAGRQESVIPPMPRAKAVLGSNSQ